MAQFLLHKWSQISSIGLNLALKYESKGGGACEKAGLGELDISCNILHFLNIPVL